jgi:hypothetical protein
MGIHSKGGYEKHAHHLTLVRSKGQDPFSDILFGFRRNYLLNLTPGKRPKGVWKNPLYRLDPRVQNHGLVPFGGGAGEDHGFAGG